MGEEKRTNPEIPTESRGNIWTHYCWKCVIWTESCR